MRATIVALLAVPVIGAAQLIRADHERRFAFEMDRYGHPSPIYLHSLALRRGHAA